MNKSFFPTQIWSQVPTLGPGHCPMSRPAGPNLSQCPKFPSPGPGSYLGQFLCQGPGAGLIQLRAMKGIVEQKFFSNSKLVPSPDSGPRPMSQVPKVKNISQFPKPDFWSYLGQFLSQSPGARLILHRTVLGTCTGVQIWHLAPALDVGNGKVS